jgi:hypothetical protein
MYTIGNLKTDTNFLFRPERQRMAIQQARYPEKLAMSYSAILKPKFVSTIIIGYRQDNGVEFIPPLFEGAPNLSRLEMRCLTGCPTSSRCRRSASILRPTDIKICPTNAPRRCVLLESKCLKLST